MMAFQLYKGEISGSFYSWRGGAWIVAASMIFSLVAYLLLTDKELSLLDQGEMLFTLTEIVISLGIIMSVTLASSAIASEIESGTFESLLLTPLTGKQIAFQKLLSIITTWFLLYAVSIPYLLVISRGTNLSLSAIFYTGFYGTILVIAFSSLSIAISVRIRSSKNSIMLSLMILLILLAPSVFFATSLKKTGFGIAIENINPVSHAMNSLDSVLVDNQQTLSEQEIHIVSVIVFAIACLLILLRFSHQFEVRPVE
jgi:ABC-2 type transport system permease protein